MNSLADSVLKYAEENPGFSRDNLAKHLKNAYSKGYLSEQLTVLTKTNKLVRFGSGKYVRYALPNDAAKAQMQWKRTFVNANLDEDKIFSQLEKEALPLFTAVPPQVHSIITYAFTEMLNNAIDHSQSAAIHIQAGKTKDQIYFKIRDRGVGVFRNISRKHRLEREIDAIGELLKGKQTTAPAQHSGEGIFFTSKVADLFILESFNLRLRIDNTIPDIFVEEPDKTLTGTEVTFSIHHQSTKNLTQIFEAYQSNTEDYNFDKTQIKIKLFTLGTEYISRSQARRVLTSLDKFKHIILDFDQVNTIGQGFADEVFRVFPTHHPHIMIEAIELSKPVAFMAKRVQAPANVRL